MLALHTAPSFSQSSLYQQYIEKYKDIAIREMQRYGIPASITLAQGLLESGAGTSLLAQKANNHFGIKTGGTWTGPYFVKDDDAPDERFRSYSSVLESYEDHSLFLKNRSRYASLFTLSSTDYEGWARGLKTAGYATNPEYANKLISIIKIYNLHQYDLASSTAVQTPNTSTKNKVVAKNNKKGARQSTAVLEIRRCNGVPYIVSRQGDTWETIARATGKSEKKLRKYNEQPSPMQLSGGSIVYIEKKQSHADASLRGKAHQIRPGESLYTIAQRYAVTLKSLYKKNKLDPDYEATLGDTLLLP